MPRCHLVCGADPPVRSRRPRRLPQSLLIPEEPGEGVGADQGIPPTRSQLFLEIQVALSENAYAHKQMSYATMIPVTDDL
jgi:hypothetical protein